MCIFRHTCTQTYTTAVDENERDCSADNEKQVTLGVVK